MGSWAGSQPSFCKTILLGALSKPPSWLIVIYSAKRLIFLQGRLALMRRLLWPLHYLRHRYLIYRVTRGQASLRAIGVTHIFLVNTKMIPMTRLLGIWPMSRVTKKW